MGHGSKSGYSTENFAKKKGFPFSILSDKKKYFCCQQEYLVLCSTEVPHRCSIGSVAVCFTGVFLIVYRSLWFVVPQEFRHFVLHDPLLVVPREFMLIVSQGSLVRYFTGVSVCRTTRVSVRCSSDLSARSSTGVLAGSSARCAI